MAVTVLLEAQTQDGQADGLLDFLKQILPDTRNYEGYIDINVIQDQDNPNTIILVEKWETKSHYEKYLQWRTENGDIDKLGSFMTGPPSIRFFNRKDA